MAALDALKFKFEVKESTLRSEEAVAWKKFNATKNNEVEGFIESSPQNLVSRMREFLIEFHELKKEDGLKCLNQLKTSWIELCTKQDRKPMYIDSIAQWLKLARLTDANINSLMMEHIYDKKINNLSSCSNEQF